MIEEALALFKASHIINTSIKFSLTGLEVDCTTKMWFPRTESSILRLISPSANLEIVQLDKGMPDSLEISSAILLFEERANN